MKYTKRDINNVFTKFIVDAYGLGYVINPSACTVSDTENQFHMTKGDGTVCIIKLNNSACVSKITADTKDTTQQICITSCPYTFYKVADDLYSDNKDEANKLRAELHKTVDETPSIKNMIKDIQAKHKESAPKKTDDNFPGYAYVYYKDKDGKSYTGDEAINKLKELNKSKVHKQVKSYDNEIDNLVDLVHRQLNRHYSSVWDLF